MTRKENEIIRLKNVDYRVRELEYQLELYHKLISSFGIDPKLISQKINELGIKF